MKWLLKVSSHLMKSWSWSLNTPPLLPSSRRPGPLSFVTVKMSTKQHPPLLYNWIDVRIDPIKQGRFKYSVTWNQAPWWNKDHHVAGSILMQHIAIISDTIIEMRKLAKRTNDDVIFSGPDWMSVYTLWEWNDTLFTVGGFNGANRPRLRQVLAKRGLHPRAGAYIRVRKHTRIRALGFASAGGPNRLWHRREAVARVVLIVPVAVNYKSKHRI